MDSVSFVVFAAIAISLLVLIFEMDRRNQRIFLWPVVCLGVVGFVYHLLIGDRSLASLAITAAVGGGFFGLQFALSRGRAIGSGDVCLGVALGILFSLSQLLFVFFLAYVGGSVAAIVLLLAKRMKRTDPFPLGSCLAIAGIITLFIPSPWMYLGLPW